MGNYPPCQKMWCGKCYTSEKSLHFHVASVENHPTGESSVKEEQNDKERLQTAWKSKHQKPTDFHVARDGDHLMVPFECDLCIFRKLRKQNPDKESATDRLLLGCIRRANLDAFWSRTTNTVTQNMRKVRQSIAFSRSLGLDGAYNHFGPYGLEDQCGYEVAYTILLYSRHPGRNSNTHTQFETIRKLRTAYTNYVRASTASNMEHLTLLDDKGRYQRLSRDTCGSLWFHRFMLGTQIRMGQIWKPNKGMSIELLLRMLRKSEGRIIAASSEEERHMWIVYVTYCVVSYVLSLRGNEGFLLDLKSLNKHNERDYGKYFVIGLLGKIKGEHNDREHCIPCSSKTTSGIDVKFTVFRLMEEKRKLGFTSGPAISNTKGVLYTSSEIDDLLIEILEELFEEEPTLFPPVVDSKLSLRDSYHCFRTFRRTSDSRAIEQNVSQLDIDVINRWDQVERSKGKKPSQPMRMHYAEFELLVEPFIRYTLAM